MDTRDVDELSAAKRALLERRLHEAVASPSAAAPAPVARTPPDGPATISPAQEQLWYFSRLAPENPVYNEVVSIHRTGPLDVPALRLAFDELLVRHEIWRSTFSEVDSEPVQVVHAPTACELPLVDVSEIAPGEREREAGRIAATRAREPYDLRNGPLVRPLLVRFAEDEHRLYLCLHHLIFDGISLARVVLPELSALYDAFARGEAHALGEPSIQYRDYAAASRADADAGGELRHVEHWRRRLRDLPTLELPLDHPRPTAPRFRGAMTAVSVPPALTEQLRALALSAGTTLFGVVAASYSVLLQRFSGQDDVVFGTISDLRDRPELERMVGYCVTPLIIRADLGDDPPFTELVQRCRDELLDALAHAMPFGRLVAALAPRRRPGANPLFQVGCVLQPRALTTEPGWSLRLTEVGAADAVGNAKFDLLLELDEAEDGGLDGRLTYDRDLFSPATADRLVSCWTTLLGGIVADPGRRISELALLSEAQRRRQLVEWNATAAPYERDLALPELLAAQARRTPDAVAAVFGAAELSYRELDERSDHLAGRLAARNPERAPVAVYLERSLEMLVGLLGILKSGAAYLPLDLGHPASRLRWMLEDSGAGLLLTDSELAPSLTGHRARVVCLDQPDEAVAGVAPTPPAPQDIAYVLYTSGSTGTPKGVCVTHRCLVSLLSAFLREPGFSPQDTIVAITTYAFDIAAVELWLPLLVGARMVIAGREIATDGRRLAALLEESEITVMQGTPATWQMLIDSGWSGRAQLTAVSAGDALSQKLADELVARTARLWNMYGTTETTIHSTVEPITAGAPVTIGRPIANTRFYIVDRRRQLVPVGVTGELAIAGDGVGRGYLNRPELTSERFVADPFVAGERMYLTGDLGRYLPDGRMEHLGRADRQIKLRGFRVEPGEIEAALTDAPEIAAAVVVAHGDGPADTRLIAYVVPRDAPPDSRELRARLGATLPAYMIPAAFVAVDELPMSANGKIDRAALPEPRLGSSTGPDPRERTPAQDAMAAIWERVLGIDQVRIDDDFFELGGHSLLALRLLVEVQRELGVEVPVSSFFAQERVTVAGLAAAVAQDADADPAVVGSEAAQPLFFVHPNVSTLPILRHFAAPLGSDWQLVGLPPDTVAGRFDRSQTVESIAETMLDTVRRTQPDGPYYLAGYSLGGLLAYELASRLRAGGERVAWLGVLDASTPAAATRWWQSEFTVRRRLARQWRRGPRGAWAELDRYVRRELALRRIRLRPGPGELTDVFDWPGAMRLAMQYTCRPHDAPMDLFATEVTAGGTHSDSLGWSEVHAGRLRLHRLPGDHRDMVTTHVTTVAGLVRAGLEEARGDRSER